jgi:hypothetical protein
LGKRLRREAISSGEQTYSRLSGRVLGAILARRTDTYSINVKLWIAAAAACFALFFLLSSLLMVGQRADEQNIIQAKQPQMSEAIEELRIIYRQVGRELPIINPGEIEKPLENEFKSLTNDTQSAVRFLVACINVEIADAKGRILN